MWTITFIPINNSSEIIKVTNNLIMVNSAKVDN